MCLKVSLGVCRFTLMSLLCLLFSNVTFAWGKRGHEIIASIGAELLVQKRGAQYLKVHGFDLGYYSNVPDIIFRNINSETSQLEGPQHFIDWNEKFIKTFEKPENLPVSFSEYKEKFSEGFNRELGLVPWRIRSLIDECKGLANQVMQNHELNIQGKLLVCLGVLSHYVGDLSMPLHVTDNFDGQKTHQQGVHAFFEVTVVDSLDPGLKVNVLEKSQQLFDEMSQQKLNPDQRVRALVSDSFSQIDELLAIDLKTDRKDIGLAKKRFRELVTRRLVKGSVVNALIWEEILKGVTEFNEKKFYFFDGSPKYIYPKFETEG